VQSAAVVERALAFDGVECRLRTGGVVAGEAELVVAGQDRGDAAELTEPVDRAGEGDRVRALVGGVERAPVEDVAGDEVPAFGLVEGDVPGRVAGSMDD
jgi:hypothetical protein